MIRYFRQRAPASPVCLKLSSKQSTIAKSMYRNLRCHNNSKIRKSQILKSNKQKMNLRKSSWRRMRSIRGWFYNHSPSKKLTMKTPLSLIVITLETLVATKALGMEIIMDLVVMRARMIKRSKSHNKIRRRKVPKRACHNRKKGFQKSKSFHSSTEVAPSTSSLNLEESRRDKKQMLKVNKAQMHLKSQRVQLHRSFLRGVEIVRCRRS